MSAFVDWSDELLTGIPEIDSHHKALLGLLNELHTAVHRRLGVDACRQTVEKLRRCALSHLEVEERLMRDFGHGEFARDQEEQRELVRQLDGMLARMDDVQSNITFHGLHRLRVWLLEHIRRVQNAEATSRHVDEEGTGITVFGLTLKRAPTSS